ncbi:MAG: N-acetyl-gamma-glutamyl-phosphate reductase [Gammaproteobacteria bacterium]|nr:N-acetyl-gamma-glutamyl-phosphate reductase [Gammaproteobacteria bacterium]MDH3759016.1 N-acetyl-gamma-glutamyl-phosphate reductase [Gammaproteobacteria bacterium]
MSTRIPTVIIGASGYVGGELLRLIAGHPNFSLAAAVSDSGAGKPIGDIFGHLATALAGHRFVAHGDWLDHVAADSQLALFSAAPHGDSAAVIASAIDACNKKGIDVHVVDSSADFRFAKQDDWESVYKAQHGAPELLDKFICALPEHVDSVDVAHVGHPGCFATASTLATVPLIKSGLTEAEVFISGITGSTGSGKSPSPGTHHPERNSNFYAYKPLAHRHAPEVSALAEQASGRKTTVHFVPHSGPFARGIHVTLQAKAKAPVTEAQLRSVYENAYRDAPFVQVVSGTPRIKNVVASNQCHISVATDGDTVVVMAAIDNLVKGAAGGAMQWMNRLWDLPETAGLEMPAPGWT